MEPVAAQSLQLYVTEPLHYCTGKVDAPLPVESFQAEGNKEKLQADDAIVPFIDGTRCAAGGPVFPVSAEEASVPCSLEVSINETQPVLSDDHLVTSVASVSEDLWSSMSKSPFVPSLPSTANPQPMATERFGEIVHCGHGNTEESLCEREELPQDSDHELDVPFSGLCSSSDISQAAHCSPAAIEGVQGIPSLTCLSPSTFSFHADHIVPSVYFSPAVTSTPSSCHCTLAIPLTPVLHYSFRVTEPQPSPLSIPIPSHPFSTLISPFGKVLEVEEAKTAATNGYDHGFHSSLYSKEVVQNVDTLICNDSLSASGRCEVAHINDGKTSECDTEECHSIANSNDNSASASTFINVPDTRVDSIGGYDTHIDIDGYVNSGIGEFDIDKHGNLSGDDYGSVDECDDAPANMDHTSECNKTIGGVNVGQHDDTTGNGDSDKGNITGIRDGDKHEHGGDHDDGHSEVIDCGKRNPDECTIICETCDDNAPENNTEDDNNSAISISASIENCDSKAICSDATAIGGVDIHADASGECVPNVAPMFWLMVAPDKSVANCVKYNSNTNVIAMSESPTELEVTTTTIGDITLLAGGKRLHKENDMPAAKKICFSFDHERQVVNGDTQDEKEEQLPETEIAHLGIPIQQPQEDADDGCFSFDHERQVVNGDAQDEKEEQLPETEIAHLGIPIQQPREDADDGSCTKYQGLPTGSKVNSLFINSSCNGDNNEDNDPDDNGDYGNYTAEGKKVPQTKTKSVSATAIQQAAGLPCTQLVLTAQLSPEPLQVVPLLQLSHLEVKSEQSLYSHISELKNDDELCSTKSVDRYQELPEEYPCIPTFIFPPSTHCHKLGTDIMPTGSLNLAKPKLRIGLSKRQHCKPLHHSQ